MSRGQARLYRRPRTANRRLDYSLRGHRLPLVVAALVMGLVGRALGQSVVRWQYGELRMNDYIWATGTAQTIGTSNVDLARRLGVAGVGSPGTSLSMRIVDRLGAQGWELVAIESAGSVIEGTGTYLFKRRTP
jgi:hypothetical protein